ncbi:MAG: hypothetical protein WBJ10_11625 [Daejeonella sp.]|uniref:hypothetical protein n=1 Tax=Daejeonella sp. TaxID=2805397 RepID=UPI003C786460
MKAYNENQEEVLVELIKFSIFFILFMITMNGFTSRAESLRFRESPGLSVMQTKVQQIYTSQIGVREQQPNSGPAVETYLRYVNLPRGNPWCAAFDCCVYGRPGVGNPRTGWSPDLFGEGLIIWSAADQRTKSKEQGLPPSVPYAYPHGLTTNNEQGTTPTTGDIFGLYFPEKHRIAHVGFIDQWDGTWMISVEGNTNISGSREGDGVYRKRRLVKSVYKVARYISDSEVISGGAQSRINLYYNLRP